MAKVKSVHNEPGTKPSAEPCPTFGPHTNTSAADFNFQQEVEHLPFKLNLGDVHLEKEHQARFIDLIYSNQEVFSLHDEDLGYCNKLTHTIPTSTDKPVYPPHRTILRQLQGEVCKCLNTWLHQGIIQPSNSPYASQVVLVWKKTREIHICVDYRIVAVVYLDDICIFAPDVSAMLDQMELVFSQLKSFNLKIKPKKSYFFQASVIFLGHVLSSDGISANQGRKSKGLASAK